MPKVEPWELNRINSRFMPRLYRDNEDLAEFLIPFDGLYNELLSEGTNLELLMDAGRCPRRMLPLLASNLAFELPEHRFATEMTQRRLLGSASYINANRGHINCVKRFLEILGFTYVSHYEEVSDSLRANAGRSYSYPIRVLYNHFTDDWDDQNMDGWAKSRAGSTWSVLNGRLLGTGDGTDNWDNNCLFEDYNIDRDHPVNCYKVDFEVLGGSGSKHPNFGITMYDIEGNTGVQVGFRTDGATDYLDHWIIMASTPTIAQSKDITGLVNYKTGVHSMIVWEFTDKLTIGLDDITLVHEWDNLPDLLKIDAAHPGLFVNQSTQVAFDNYQFDRIGSLVPNRIFSTGVYDKKLTIIYTWSGSASEKNKWLEYLNKVLPNYIPIGVEIVWEEQT